MVRPRHFTTDLSASSASGFKHLLAIRLLILIVQESVEEINTTEGAYMVD